MWCRNNRVTVHLSGFLLHVIIYHMVITTFMQAALHNNPYTSHIPVSKIWTLIPSIAVWCLPLRFKRVNVVTVIHHLFVTSRYKQETCLLDIISIVLSVLCCCAILQHSWGTDNGEQSVEDVNVCHRLAASQTCLLTVMHRYTRRRRSVIVAVHLRRC